MNVLICEQEVGGADWRDLPGLPSDKLSPSKNLQNWAIGPAAEEVNGLSDFCLEVEAIREGGLPRGKLAGFRLSWRRKDKDEWQSVLDELGRSKVGRKARMKGKVEMIAA